MKNLEKLNRKSASPAPAPYFNLLFLFFRFPPSGGGNQNLLPPPLKRVGGANYVTSTTKFCHVTQTIS